VIITVTLPTLLTHQATLIVLHLMGSHGPTYYRRYPQKFSTFLPDCQQSDIQNCTSEQLVNTYDNTIHYSDYVIAEVINKLAEFTKKNTQKINAEVIYVSDHGESLGENGLYLHGFPYAIAPIEQTHIPMLFWSNNMTIYFIQCLVNSMWSHQHINRNLIFSSHVAITLPR
jgi:lipid A ethanolaminephosphotransferase